MASTEEVLKALQNAKITTLAATEPEELVIDAESRTITVPSSERLFGVTGDMNIERKYFRCPKIVGDNVDLSTHQIFIAYVYTETESGSIFPSIGVTPYHCEDVEVDGEDITFSWKLTGNVFKNPGFILFKMYAKKTETDPNTVFNTTPAIGTVLATIPDGTEEIVEEHPDVIAQIFDRLDALESGGGGGTGGTTNYENLSNKPKLNGVTLEGNKTLDQVGVLAKNQGASNSGKFLSVGSDGNVVFADAPSGGTVDPEQIKQAVNGYLEENPVSGMTAEQEQQLNQNTTDVANLKSANNQTVKKDDIFYVGEVTELYEADNVAYNRLNLITQSGKSVKIPVKAGDALIFLLESDYITTLPTDYRYWILINEDGAISKTQYPANYITISPDVDGYLIVNLSYSTSSIEGHIRIYRNRYADSTSLDSINGLKTTEYQYMHEVFGIRGILSTLNNNIKYDKGFYFVYTDGTYILESVTGAFKNGDIVYFDGEFFYKSKIPSKTINIIKNKHYNAIIIGSGASGMSAAINLASSGLSVAIIEKNKSLGGTHTSGGVIELIASPVDDSLKAVIKDMYDAGYSSFSKSDYKFGSGTEFDQLWNGSMLNWSDGSSHTPSDWGNSILINDVYAQQYYYNKLMELGVDIYLDTKIEDVVMDGDYIRAVVDSHGKNYYGDFFVDASDNIIIRKIGEKDTDYFFGYDGKSRYGETACIFDDSDETICNTFELAGISYRPNTAAIPTPKIYIPYDKIYSKTNMNNTWRAPTKVNELVDYAYQRFANHNILSPGGGQYGIQGIQPSEFLQKGEEYVYSKYFPSAFIMPVIGNSKPYGYTFPCEMLGIRESYRLNGIIMAKQDDITTELTGLGDKSIIASWYCDQHGAAGLDTSLLPFRKIIGCSAKTMLSAKAKNYINPSKGKGMTHIAHAAFRLMRTCWLSGRIAAEIIKTKYQTTNDLSDFVTSTINDNSGLNDLFTEIKSYQQS